MTHPLGCGCVNTAFRRRYRLKTGEVGPGRHMQLSPTCCTPSIRKVYLCFRPVSDDVDVVQRILTGLKPSSYVLNADLVPEALELRAEERLGEAVCDHVVRRGVCDVDSAFYDFLT